MHARVGNGRYTLTSRKGAGGVGEVWAARDARLERDVAVKILRGTDSQMAARFRQEALATASLVHPNIVHVSDYFVEEGVPYIVMELLAGVSLSELVHALGPLDPRRAVKLVMDVCSALEYAHGRGVIHRDIKPANIQVVPDASGAEHASVLDFGIAKLVDATALTEEGSAVGTPCFMAPEQVSGAPADARIDVYSAGVTLYFALSAELPFTGATPHEVIAALMAGSVRPLRTVRPDLDPALVAIVERATAYAPDQRFSSASELHAALANWLRSATRSSPPLHSSAPPQASPPAHPGPTTTNLVAHALPTAVEPAILRRRRRAARLGVVLACAGLSLAATLVVVVVLSRGSPSTEPAARAPAEPVPSIAELVPLASSPSALPPLAPPPLASTPPPPSLATPPATAHTAPRSEPAAPSCARPSWPCAGRCVDLESNRAHCGACNVACASDKACINGACRACPIGVGFSLCDGRCIQTFTDPNNCGTCQRKCPYGRCQAGRCT